MAAKTRRRIRDTVVSMAAGRFAAICAGKR
jgi:hypothetical protein